MVIFSQYLGHFQIPCFGYSKELRCHMVKYPVFKMFPVSTSRDAETCERTQLYVNTCIHTHTHTHTHARVYMISHMHKHTHTHVYMYTHTHTHTHTHAHYLNNVYFLSYLFNLVVLDIRKITNIIPVLVHYQFL